MVRHKNELNPFAISKLPKVLCDTLKELSPLAIAYSGGLDSRFLCYAAKLLGMDFVAVHAKGPHVPAEETSVAIEWAKKHNINLKIIAYDPLIDKNVIQNDQDRCYYCKKKLFTKMKIDGYLLVDGTNADDLKSYRPGLRALQKLGIFSPLAKSNLNKIEIRQYATAIGLENANQKAKPCLLTRFAYGIKPDYDRLLRLECAEKELQIIFGPNIDFRIRLMPAPLLQVQGIKLEQKKAVDLVMQKNGFFNYQMNIDQSISGFFDRAK